MATQPATIPFDTSPMVKPTTIPFGVPSKSPTTVPDNLSPAVKWLDEKLNITPDSFLGKIQGFFTNKASGESPYVAPERILGGETSGLNKALMTPTTPYKGTDSNPDIATGAAVNLPTSGFRNMAMIANPETYIGLSRAIAGAVHSIPGIGKLISSFDVVPGVTPEAKAQAEAENQQAFHGLLTGLHDQYGSIENIKRSIKEDPVGMLLLSEGLLKAGSGLAKGAGALADAAKLPGTAAALGDVSGRLGRAAELPAQAGMAVGRVVAKGAPELGKRLADLAQFATVQSTGLSPETVRNIIFHPENFSSAEMAKYTRAGVASEALGDITTRLNDLSDLGKEYGPVRSSGGQVIIPEEVVRSVFSKRGISVGADGQLGFTKESIPTTAGDRAALQFWYDTYGKDVVHSPNSYLNMRQGLEHLEKYDAAKTDAVNVLARDFRGELNNAGRFQIPGLEELDARFSAEISELKKVKKDYFNHDGSLKDNAISKISNATGKGKEQLLTRLEKVSPGITGKIRTLKAVEDLAAAGGHKVGTYGRGAVIGGAILTGNIPALVAAVLSTPEIAVKILRGYGKLLGVKDAIVKSIVGEYEASGGAGIENTSPLSGGLERAGGTLDGGGRSTRSTKSTPEQSATGLGQDVSLDGSVPQVGQAVKIRTVPDATGRQDVPVKNRGAHTPDGEPVPVNVVRRDGVPVSPDLTGEQNVPISPERGRSIPIEVGTGDFGTIYEGPKGQDAIDFLLANKEGEVRGALSHPILGDIDIIWGAEDTPGQKGHGLAHIAQNHPEVLDTLQKVLSDSNVTQRLPGRRVLTSSDGVHRSIVDLEFNNKDKNWFVNQYEIKSARPTGEGGPSGSTALRRGNPRRGVLGEGVEPSTPPASRERSTGELTKQNPSLARGDASVNTKPTKIPVSGPPMEGTGAAVARKGYDVPEEVPVRKSASEAREYKSADEFVKAQGTPVYHFTDEASVGSIEKQGIRSTPASEGSISEGISVATKRTETNAQFGNAKVPAYISPEAKTITLKEALGKMGYANETDIGVIKNVETQAPAWAKKNGYDVLDMRDARGAVYKGMDEIRVLNPDVLKTKSQLTDLWKKTTNAKPTKSAGWRFFKVGTPPADYPHLAEVGLSKVSGFDTKLSTQLPADEINNGVVRSRLEELKIGKGLEPILGEFGTDGKFYIDDGSHRIEALRQFGAKKTDVIPVYSRNERLATKIEIKGGGGAAIGGEHLAMPVEVKSPYKGEKLLTTKVLDRLVGKTTVSKQFIEDLARAGDLKQAERDLINKTLKESGDTVYVKEFANRVKAELLPLTSSIGDPLNVAEATKLIKEAERRGDWATAEDLTNRMENSDLSHGTRFESVTLPDEIRGPVAKYAERIYESPIKTSAGDVHFNGATDNYFAHTRIEDLPVTRTGSSPDVALKDLPSTRRVIELQSDLFQKGRLEGEATFSLDHKVGDRVTQRSGTSGVITKVVDTNPKEITIKLDDGRSATVNPMHIVSGGASDLRKAEIAKLKPYENTWHERIIREEVKQAAMDGKTKLQFPTGETAMKIEGLGETSKWFDSAVPEGGEPGVGRPLKPEGLKVGKTVHSPDGNGEASNWIITDVLGDGKFKAVQKDAGDFLQGNKGMEMQEFNAAGDELSVPVPESMKESFDISGKVDQSNPIYKFYEKTVARYLRNKYNATLITDPQGVQWMQVKVDPKAAKQPVEAKRKDDRKLA